MTPNEKKQEREGVGRTEDETKEWGSHDEHPYADRRVRKKIGELIAKAQQRRQQNN
jgi:hypothetical protein